MPRISEKKAVRKAQKRRGKIQKKKTPQEVVMEAMLKDFHTPYKNSKTSRAGIKRRELGVKTKRQRIAEDEAREQARISDLPATFSETNKNQQVATPFSRSRWKQVYIEELMEHGDRNKALEVCNKVFHSKDRITTIDIKRACDPAGDGYDKQFFNLITSVEDSLIWQIEDNFLQRALSDSGDAKVVLSTRIPERYAAANAMLRSATGDVGVVQNNFWFTTDDQGKAVDMLKRLFPSREITDGETGHQPAIDVTPSSEGAEGEPSENPQGLLEA